MACSRCTRCGPLLHLCLRCGSICLCWSHWCAVQKRLNRSRCCLGLNESHGGCRPPSNNGSLGLWAHVILNDMGPKTQRTIIGWGSRSPTGRDTFEGSRANLKSLGVSAAAFEAKGIIQTSITRMMQPTVGLMLLTTLSPVKNRPPCDVAFFQNSLTTC